MQHPGLLLPACLATTQSLFGPHPNKVGTPRTLRVQSPAIVLLHHPWVSHIVRWQSVGLAMPHGTPRYVSSDCGAMSTGVASHFRPAPIALTPPDALSVLTILLRLSGRPRFRLMRMGSGVIPPSIAVNLPPHPLIPCGRATTVRVELQAAFTGGLASPNSLAVAKSVRYCRRHY